MSSSNRTRPLSPHLTIWRWGPHMAVSILHRATGSGMATVGAILLVWWLVALASGEEREMDSAAGLMNFLRTLCQQHPAHPHAHPNAKSDPEQTP